MHILDNKCSAKFKERIQLNNMQYQLAPPNDHRRNITEKAIQVFKAHSISILCGTDKAFPLHLWDRLLGQAEHTLNMLQISRMMPSMSAYAYLWGKHNYNANPFAPLECKVEAHVMPSIQETWAPYTASGFYVRNVWEHYRCHKIYLCDSKHENMSHCVLQTQVPNNAHNHTGGCTHSRSGLPHKALAGLVPTPTCTQDAVDQLMVIFKQQARAAKDAATAQRVLKNAPKLKG
jgi:hypothetical protein